MNLELLKQAAMLNKSDILQPFDAIVDLGGFESVCAFSDYFGGGTVYIPKPNVIFRRCVEREAIKEYRGEGSYRSLMKKYGMSESYWRKVINGK